MDFINFYLLLNYFYSCELTSKLRLANFSGISSYKVYFHKFSISKKHYVFSNGQKEYVPVIEGEVGYDTILNRIFKYCQNDLVVTVETHAKDNKVEMSSRAIMGTRLLLSKQGVNL